MSAIVYTQAVAPTTAPPPEQHTEPAESAAERRQTAIPLPPPPNHARATATVAQNQGQGQEREVQSQPAPTPQRRREYTTYPVHQHSNSGGDQNRAPYEVRLSRAYFICGSCRLSA